MILTITLILGFLVALNFALLFLSCNKTKKSTKVYRKPQMIKRTITTEEVPSQLAPTGS